MRPNSKTYYLKIAPITVEQALSHLLNITFLSAVGHESTAKLLTQILGFPITVNRIQIKLEKGDILIVFQLLQRLPEGKVLEASELEKIPYQFFLVEVR
jgi:hypothetical protein